jgi:flagellar basal body-associated protein FliL
MADEQKKHSTAEKRNDDEGAAATTTPAAEAKPVSRLILVFGFLVMLLTPTAGYFLATLSMPTRGGSLHEEQKQEQQHQAEEKGLEREMSSAVFPMNSMLINIADTRGTRMLKLTPHLLLREPGLSAKLAPLKVLLVDGIATETSSKTLDDLDGPAGRERLKKDIIHRLNKLLEAHMPDPVADIYFEEFLIQ